jgi:hypothetical protein
LEVITNCDHLAPLKFAKSLPFAFTEHGALMAATVLSTPQAVAMSVYVVRAFIQMREQLAANREILKRLTEIDKTLLEHDSVLRDIYRNCCRYCSHHLSRQNGASVLGRMINDYCRLIADGQSLTAGSFHSPFTIRHLPLSSYLLFAIHDLLFARLVTDWLHSLAPAFSRIEWGPICNKQLVAPITDVTMSKRDGESTIYRPLGETLSSHWLRRGVLSCKEAAAPESRPQTEGSGQRQVPDCHSFLAISTSRERKAMKAQIKLGRVAGIEIGLHYSWFIIALLITLAGR